MELYNGTIQWNYKMELYNGTVKYLYIQELNLLEKERVCKRRMAVNY